MRVVNSSMYRNYTSSLNKVHSQLNKSFNKISSSKAYETAADNPLAYYAGKKWIINTRMPRASFSS